MITINGLSFKLTCAACPEQYDVFKGDQQVGYIRLRHGYLACEYPDVCGELLYEERFEDEPWKGEFEDNEERQTYLKLCAEAIGKRLGE